MQIAPTRYRNRDYDLQILGTTLISEQIEYSFSPRVASKGQSIANVNYNALFVSLIYANLVTPL